MVQVLFDWFCFGGTKHAMNGNMTSYTIDVLVPEVCLGGLLGRKILENLGALCQRCV